MYVDVHFRDEVDAPALDVGAGDDPAEDRRSRRRLTGQRPPATYSGAPAPSRVRAIVDSPTRRFGMFTVPYWWKRAYGTSVPNTRRPRARSPRRRRRRSSASGRALVGAHDLGALTEQRLVHERRLGERGPARARPSKRRFSSSWKIASSAGQTGVVRAVGAHLLRPVRLLDLVQAASSATTAANVFVDTYPASPYNGSRPLPPSYTPASCRSTSAHRASSARTRSRAARPSVRRSRSRSPRASPSRR